MKPGAGAPPPDMGARLASMKQANDSSPQAGAAIPNSSGMDVRPAETTGAEGNVPVSQFFEAGGTGMGATFAGAKAGFFAFIESGGDMLANLASTSLNSLTQMFGNAFGNSITDAFEGNMAQATFAQTAALENVNIGFNDVGLENTGVAKQTNMTLPTPISSQNAGASM